MWETLRTVFVARQGMSGCRNRNSDNVRQGIAHEARRQMRETPDNSKCAFATKYTLLHSAHGFDVQAKLNSRKGDRKSPEHWDKVADWKKGIDSNVELLF